MGPRAEAATLRLGGDGAGLAAAGIVLSAAFAGAAATAAVARGAGVFCAGGTGLCETQDSFVPAAAGAAVAALLAAALLHRWRRAVAVMGRPGFVGTLTAVANLLALTVCAAFLWWAPGDPATVLVAAVVVTGNLCVVAGLRGRRRIAGVAGVVLVGAAGLAVGAEPVAWPLAPAAVLWLAAAAGPTRCRGRQAISAWSR